MSNILSFKIIVGTWYSAYKQIMQSTESNGVEKYLFYWLQTILLKLSHQRKWLI